MNDTDVVIVGGGVIGLTTGWRALQAGLSVTLVERDPVAAQRTSRVAAGVLAPVGTDPTPRPALLALGRESARMYPDFVAELAAATGSDPGYRQTGTLLVAADLEQVPALEAEFAFRESQGIAATRLLPSEARRLEPALAPTLAMGVEVPDDHLVDPRALCAVLSRAFTRAGGDLRLGTEVAAISVSHRRAHGVRLGDGEILSAEHVVVAAGPWSDQVAGLPAAAQIRLRPVKGQILALRDPEGPGRVQRAVRLSGGYLVPRGDGRYVLGATNEERGFDNSITAEAVAGLLVPAIAQIPAVAGWRLEELMAGSRPATSDGLPVIGASPVVDGLIWATGHHRQGLLLAPVSAAIVLDDILGRPAGELAAPVSPARFVDAVGAPAADGRLHAGATAGLPR